MASTHSLPTRPKIFVGSSGSDQHIAGVLSAALADLADTTSACEGVADASRTFDVAVFVLGGVSDAGTLLRLGMFLGALGRERVVIVCPTSGTRELPPELQDVTVAAYAVPSDGNFHQALASACGTVTEHVQRLMTPAGSAVVPTAPAPQGARQIARRLRRSLGTACSVRSGQTLRIADISLTGALLETYGEIPEHQLLDLDLTLEGGGSVRVTAKVVRIQYPQWGRVGGVGVAFTRFDGDSQAVLTRYFDPIAS
jgi:hypothetical protein